MSVALPAISPLASVRGPVCNERQSGKQGYPPPTAVRGGLIPAVDLAMSTELSTSEQQPASLFTPTPQAARRMLEFFTAQINNPHTRRAYLNVARRFHSGPAGPAGPGYRQAAPGGSSHPV